jgi:SAM-dependent methyltransferase
MNTDYTKSIFSNINLVNYYDKLTTKVGLFKSEAIIFNQYVKRQDKILDLGCGTGRTTIGLYQLGFKNVIGADISEKMIEKAKQNANTLNYPIQFEIADALSLPFSAGSFNVIFFSFNGLMLIPQKINRNMVTSEIHRILVNKGYFIFSTPYLDNKLDKSFWAQRLIESKHDINNEKFGDIFLEDCGVQNIFIHIPMSSEIIEMLGNESFDIIEMIPRINICKEDDFIENELDENMFWVARKK